MPIYSVIPYKFIINIERSFDSEGKPFQIYDDDLDEIFSKSDYARGRGHGHA